MRVLCKPLKLTLIPKQYPFRETNVEISLECGHLVKTYALKEDYDSRENMPQSAKLEAEYECKECLVEFNQFKGT